MGAEGAWSCGPAVRSKDSRSVSGHSWARPATPELSAAHEIGVELAGDVTLQDAHDLTDRLSFGDASRNIFAGAFIAAHAGEHDPPQGMVGLAVPAGVESMPIDLSGRARVRRPRDARTQTCLSARAGWRRP